MPATSAVLIALFSSFFAALLWQLTVLMKQTRYLVHAIKESIYLDDYGVRSQFVGSLKSDSDGQETHLLLLRIDQVQVAATS